jgi:hypothetical protein
LAQAWNVLGAIGTPVLGEHAADRSDPETIPLDGDELADRTGQRRLRGSLSPHEERRCRLEDFGGYLQLGVTALESPDLRSIGRGDPFSVVFVDLLLADLVTQRLGVHPQPLGHRRDRRPLARIVLPDACATDPALARVTGSDLLGTKCTFPRKQVRIKRGMVHPLIPISPAPKAGT